jgi:hypothetical protein
MAKPTQTPVSKRAQIQAKDARDPFGDIHTRTMPNTSFGGNVERKPSTNRDPVSSYRSLRKFLAPTNG